MTVIAQLLNKRRKAVPLPTCLPQDNPGTADLDPQFPSMMIGQCPNESMESRMSCMLVVSDQCSARKSGARCILLVGATNNISMTADQGCVALASR